MVEKGIRGAWASSFDFCGAGTSCSRVLGVPEYSLLGEEAFCEGVCCGVEGNPERRRGVPLIVGTLLLRWSQMIQ